MLAQMMEMITQAMRGETRQMNEKMKGMNDNLNNKMEANLKQNAKQMKDEMKTNVKENAKENAKEIKNNMDEHTKTLWGEMRQVGRCLQAGKMAPPRTTTNELKGSAPAGEDRAIRET